MVPLFLHAFWFQNVQDSTLAKEPIQAKECILLNLQFMFKKHISELRKTEHLNKMLSYSQG